MSIDKPDSLIQSALVQANQAIHRQEKIYRIQEARLRLEAEYEVYLECCRKVIDGTRGILRIKSFEQWMVEK